MEKATVTVIDNCYFRLLSTFEVKHMYAERIQNWRNRTVRYRSRPDAPLVKNTLPADWPLSVFVSPEIPTMLYMATLEDRMVGLLECKVHANDYALVRKMVVLNSLKEETEEKQMEHVSYNTGVLVYKLVKDCADKNVPYIIFPRALSENSQKLGAQYKFERTTLSVQDTMSECYIHICRVLVATGYGYLHIETPFRSRFLHVEKNYLQHLNLYLHSFFNTQTDVNRKYESWCRQHPLELWRTYKTTPADGFARSVSDAPFNNGEELQDKAVYRYVDELNYLSPVEADIMNNWQKKLIYHRALRISKDGSPIRIFGKSLIAISENMQTVQIVAYRFPYSVPRNLFQIEHVNWWAVRPLNDTVASTERMKDAAVFIENPPLFERTDIENHRQAERELDLRLQLRVQNDQYEKQAAKQKALIKNFYEN